jgi:hypothetical protein
MESCGERKTILNLLPILLGSMRDTNLREPGRQVLGQCCDTSPTPEATPAITGLDYSAFLRGCGARRLRRERR